MQLAKDKVDHAIAGLDASWQSRPERMASSGKSMPGQSDGKQDGSKREKEDAYPAEVLYEGGDLDRGPDAATADVSISDEKPVDTNIVRDVEGTDAERSAS